MEFSLGLLAAWLLVFMPLGLAFHWLVLGASARVQAAAVAPVTGLALGLVVLGTARQLGVDPGTRWLAWAIVLAAVAAAVVQWRRGTAWRSRALAGAAAMLVVATIFLNLAVTGHTAVQGGATGETGVLAGPLGYGTDASPFTQVATMEGWSGGKRANTAVVKAATASADRRYTGFEQLSAFTIAMGSKNSPGPSIDTVEQNWTAYALHGIFTGLFAALAACPLFLIARWRGVKWIGMSFALLLGTIAAPMVLQLAFGQGPAVAAAPFALLCAGALLVARRDRGWYAVATLGGVAAVACAGPGALLPALLVGGLWTLLRSDAHEHLAHTDVPVARERPLVAGALVAMFGLFGVATALAHDGWVRASALHGTVGEALASWPATWLSPTLQVISPQLGNDGPMLLLAVALLAMVLAWAVRRDEPRELAILVGCLLSLGVGVAVSLGSRENGIAIVDLSWLTAAPLVALSLAWVVGDLRANNKDTPRRRSIGAVALLVASLGALVGVSAASTTGSRMTGLHAPALPAPTINPEAVASKHPRVLVAAGDSWVAYQLGGTAVGGTAAVDADELARHGNGYLPKGDITYAPWDLLVLDANPLGSDPPSTYKGELTPSFGSAPLRVFESSQLPGGGPTPKPQEHDGVEDLPGNQSTPGAAGLVLPDRAFPDCAKEGAGDSCTPDDTERVGVCSDTAVAEARSALDPKGADADAGGGKEQATGNDTTDETPRPLLAVACLRVPLDDKTDSLRLHVRDVGLILPPQDADQNPTTAFVLHGPRDPSARLFSPSSRAVTEERDAALAYGTDRMEGPYDLTFEADPGAGAQLRMPNDTGSTYVADLTDALNGIAAVLTGYTVSGSVTATNSSGTRVSFGRLFARPADVAPSCDMVVPVQVNQRRELQMSEPVKDSTNGDVASVPGLTAVVTGIEVDRDSRTATLAVGTYLQHAGQVRYVLLDWVEQWAGAGEQPACDRWTPVPAPGEQLGATPKHAASGDTPRPAADAPKGRGSM